MTVTKRIPARTKKKILKDELEREGRLMASILMPGGSTYLQYAFHLGDQETRIKLMSKNKLKPLKKKNSKKRMSRTRILASDFSRKQLMQGFYQNHQGNDYDNKTRIKIMSKYKLKPIKKKDSKNLKARKRKLALEFLRELDMQRFYQNRQGNDNDNN